MMYFKTPIKITESNIQAEFYHLCKLNNVPCYLEYKHEKSRFDAVVYDSANSIKFIIEFKSYRTFKDEKTDTKQLKKYAQYNIPIIIITRIEHVKNVVLNLKHNMYGKRPSGALVLE